MMNRAVSTAPNLPQIWRSAWDSRNLDHFPWARTLNSISSGITPGITRIYCAWTRRSSSHCPNGFMGKFSQTEDRKKEKKHGVQLTGKWYRAQVIAVLLQWTRSFFFQKLVYSIGGDVTLDVTVTHNKRTSWSNSHCSLVPSRKKRLSNKPE